MPKKLLQDRYELTISSFICRTTVSLSYNTSDEVVKDSMKKVRQAAKACQMTETLSNYSGQSRPLDHLHRAGAPGGLVCLMDCTVNKLLQRRYRLTIPSYSDVLQCQLTMSRTLSADDLVLIWCTAISINYITKATFRRRFMVAYSISSDAVNVVKICSSRHPRNDVPTSDYTSLFKCSRWQTAASISYDVNDICLGSRGILSNGNVHKRQGQKPQ